MGGGLLGSPTPNAEVVATLSATRRLHLGRGRGRIQHRRRLPAGQRVPVLAVGGFNGTDPAPTLQEFQQLVAAGRVHWFVGADAGRGLLGDTSSGGSDQARLITEWVTATFTPTTVDGTRALRPLGGPVSTSRPAARRRTARAQDGTQPRQPAPRSSTA